MARRCGCGGSSCSCLVTAGDGATVTGVGTPLDPYVVSADSSASGYRGVRWSNGTAIVGQDIFPADTAVALGYGCVSYISAYPFNANEEIFPQIVSDGGTFSVASLDVEHLADSGGAPLGWGTSGAAGSRVQTGTGLTVIDFPAYTPTFFYTSPTDFFTPTKGLKFLTKGWYLLSCTIVWES